MAEVSERPVDRRRLPAWPLALLLFLAAVSVFLHVEASRLRKEIHEAKERHSLLVLARPLEGTKALRSRYYRVRFYLGYPAAVSHAAADFMRRLGGIFQPQQVLGLHLEPGMHEIVFQLTVGIGPGASGAPARQFAILVQELQNFPDIANLTFTEKGPTGQGQPHVFSVSGQVELP